MNDDLLFLQLRDCFTAGYTLPQFCIDQNIKKPLFIAPNENYTAFLWEVHVQFDFDKRITPTFSILGRQGTEIRLSPGTLFNALELKNADEILLNEYDAIIVLSAKRLQPEIKNCIYLDNLVNYFIVHTYVDIPFFHFLRRHPKIKFFLTNFTTIQPSENNSQNENELLQKEPFLIGGIRESLENDTSGEVKTPYDVFGYTRQDVLDIISVQEVITQADGSTIFKDNPNPLIRIENGKRVTANQPDEFVNRIYFVGGCSHYGTGAPFDKTIPSYLQKLLNKAALPYRVENYSQFFTYRYQDILYNLNTLPLMPNDIVIVFFDNILSPNLPCIDVSQTFKRPHNYGEVFIDSAHVNETGYKILAEKFFEVLTQNKFFKEIQFQYPPPPPLPHRYGIPREYGESISVNEELDTYKNILREIRPKIGCIVMNANPFTLGHKYLVEYAAARVDKLFIMVVSEDKSEFTFAERFELVRRGTKEYPKVEVLPSGEFVISQKTFSGYFNKENLQEVKVDSSLDVEIFAREIAPALGVTIRFAGEEPQDTVTRQYNENMKNILPRYNIEFCEIPRRDFQGEVISAKRVRAALKAGDFEKVKALVPATTFEYLREKFDKKSEQ